jgi:hypothetical protein
MGFCPICKTSSNLEQPTGGDYSTRLSWCCTRSRTRNSAMRLTKKARPKSIRRAPRSRPRPASIASSIMDDDSGARSRWTSSHGNSSFPARVARKLHAEDGMTASDIAARLGAPFDVVAQQLLDAALLPAIELPREKSEAVNRRY